MVDFCEHKRRGLLVCLVGMDGTGKTTQSTAFVAEMRRRGLEFKRVPCRWDSATVRALMNLGIKLFSRKGRDLADYGQRSRVKGRLFRNPAIACAYQGLILFQYVFQVWTKVKIPLMLGRNIVCDRYVFDTVIDLTVDFHYSREVTARLLSRLFRVLPRPGKAFLIDLPEEVAASRNAPKGERLTPDYFSERRGLYRYVGELAGMVVVRGEDTVEAITNEIMSGCFEGRARSKA